MCFIIVYKIGYIGLSVLRSSIMLRSSIFCIVNLIFIRHFKIYVLFISVSGLIQCKNTIYSNVWGTITDWWLSYELLGCKRPTCKHDTTSNSGLMLGRCNVNPLTAKLFNPNFHPLEVVACWRDPQLQVSENYSDLTKWRSTVFKSCWLMFKRWYIMC